MEYDLYNFEKLNIPDGHPAKDEQEKIEEKPEDVTEEEQDDEE
mgnify:CR=1 FL=1